MSNFPNFNDSLLNGFPSKYNTLPKISDYQSTDLIPFNRTNDRSMNNSSPEVQDRIINLETRLNITEKSNRALLEEVVRLHNEFRTTTRHYEDAFKEERKIRSYLENNWKSGQEQIKELELRIHSNEEMLNQERYKIKELIGLSKNVEEQIYSSKKDTSVIGDRQLSKMQQLEREIESLNEDRHKLERVSFQLVEEMRMIKGKLESQGYDFSMITSELRNKSRILADEYQQNIDIMKRQIDRGDGAFNEITARSTVEQKIADLKEILNNIKSKHEEEVNERRTLEHSIMSKFSELNHAMSEQTRSRDESLRQMQYLQREKDHKAETEKLALQNKLIEVAESINSKVLEKDLRLREEQLKRQTELEKLLRSEQETRISYEREMRMEHERRLEAMRQLQTEEMMNIKENIKHDKIKYIESVKRLDEAVSLVERQIDENKYELTKIISAEIKERTNKEKQLKDRITELEEKISAVTMSLQLAVNGIADKSLPNNEKLKKIVGDLIDDYRSTTDRQIADIDSRILGLRTLNSKDDENYKDKIKEALSAATNAYRGRLDTIMLWQDATNENIAELKIQKQQLKQEIYELNEAVHLSNAEFTSRISAEMTTRIEAIETLRQEFEKLAESIPKDIVAQAELLKVKITSRKLAESMQTIKTILGMKIQSEQKLRIEEVKNLQDEIIQLRTLIQPFVNGKIPQRPLRNDEEEADKILEELNREDSNTNKNETKPEDPPNKNPPVPNEPAKEEPTHPWDEDGAPNKNLESNNS